MIGVEYRTTVAQLREIRDETVSLKDLNTFGVEVFAEYFVDASNDETITESLEWARTKSMPVFVLGGGSNIVLTKNIEGLVINISTRGISVAVESDTHAVLSIRAGENWHDFVNHCIDNQRHGIENLSLIPGKLGAAPIQNIGAYGVELSEVFVCLEAIDIADGSCVELNRSDCLFGYRDSVFKRSLRGSYAITSVTLSLDKSYSPRTAYGEIEQILASRKITDPTARDVADVVCRIRRGKLPDPRVLGNAGSFFTNPLVSLDTYAELKSRHPELVGFGHGADGVKLAAAWLVDYCGWRGYREGDIGVSESQALVLVNHGGCKGRDLVTLSGRIRDSVYATFAIRLQTEPVVL